MIIIITGASKGIGKAIAAAFAQEGNLVLLCSRGGKSLYDAVSELQTNYPLCTFKGKSVDMSVKEQILSFAEWCLQHGTPDIIVNNAGQFIPGTIQQETDGLLEQMMETNLYSAYYLTKALLPAMTSVAKGHIFNICSIASLHAYANGGSYSISKFALLGFSKNLREELKPHGIKVTSVMPGATLSTSWDGVDIDPNRIMEVNDIADMVFAASKLSPMAVVEDIVLRPQLGDL